MKHWTDIAASGPADAKYEAGVEDYRVLAQLGAGWTSHRDAATGGFWIFNASKGVLWSYDDAAALRAKMDYVTSRALGGAMIWELSGDDAAGTLLRAVSEGLAATAAKR